MVGFVFTLHEHLGSPSIIGGVRVYPSRAPGFTLHYWWGSCLPFTSSWVHPRLLVGFVFTLHEHLGSPLIICGVRVAHLFSFLCRVAYRFCFVLFVFVLCPVPNVVSVFGLSILDCPVCFPLMNLSFRLQFFLNFLTQPFLASAIFNIQTRKGRKNNILTNQFAGPYVHKRPNPLPKN
jgi:hypothetical protein